MQDLSYATRCLSAKAVNFLLSFAPTPAIQRLTFNWLVPLPTSDQLKFLLPVPERHFEPFRNHPVPMVPSGLSEHGIGAATATVTFIFKIASISAGGWQPDTASRQRGRHESKSIILEEEP